MNEIILMGYLGRDPELRYASNANQTAVCRFSLAVARDYNKEGERAADWFSCVAFGTAAENISNYFHKGSRILISGRVQTGTYEDSEGTTRAKFDVMVNKFEFVDRKNEAAEQPQQQNKTKNTGKKQQQAAVGQKYYEMPLDDEDLPF